MITLLMLLFTEQERSKAMGGRGSAGSRGSGGSGGKVFNSEEDLENAYKEINPGFKQGASSLDKDGFNNNCVKCAIAFEANARGANVQANSFKFGDSEDLSKSRAYEKAFDGANTWEVGRAKKAQTVREIELTMTEDFGVGSRAIIQEHGAGRRHTMNVVNLNGKVVVVDAQAGKHGSVNTMLTGLDTKNMTLTRTDNLKMNKEYQQWAYRSRSKR